MKHYFQNIFGWFDYETVHQYAVRLFQSGSVFAEIGVYKGKSTAYLGTEIVNSGKNINVFAVDIFESPKIVALGGYEYTQEEFEKNTEKLPVTAIKTTSIEASEQFPVKSLEYVFIDAGHTYDEVRDDILYWLPIVKDGCIIAGHDFSANWPGIEKAVREIFGYDFITVDNSWLHIKPIKVESLNQFETYVTILNATREEYVTKELKKFGIDWTKIHCVTPDDLINGTKWQANGHTFRRALNHYQASGSDKPLLILEDDIKFTGNPDLILSEAMEQLPNDWDLLYMGANITEKCSTYSTLLNKVNRAWCTHSIVYSKKAIDYILKNFNADKDSPFDEWLNHASLNRYVIKPTLITQKSGYSYIQKMDVNYECIFKSQSNLV